MGTTNTCAIDNLSELGPICQAKNLWLHVDAAYAGSFLLCPEFRWMAEGIHYVDSFNFNPHKAMRINFDCSPMWFKDATEAVKYFNVEADYETTDKDGNISGNINDNHKVSYSNTI